MIKHDEKSNGQSWELEVTCKSKEYLDAIVEAILSFGMFDFDVEVVEWFSETDGRYLVLIYGSWFSNLNKLSKKLAKIENKLDNFK